MKETEAWKAVHTSISILVDAVVILSEAIDVTNGKVLLLAKAINDTNLTVTLNEEEREMLETDLGIVSKMVTDVGLWKEENK
jgi:hypothetical protein|tara:strand:+ start:2928 stop:3173 length:246 start_codon:yes stop_codon:yes gene_type:complete